MQAKKCKNGGKTSTKKGIFSFLAVLLVLIVSYSLNVYTHSFVEANNKLISLFLYAILGYCGFYVLYYITYFITLLLYNKKCKKLAKNVISCDDDVSNLFSNDKHRFSYDKNLSFNDNINVYKEGVFNLIKQIAGGYSVGKGQYYYLNFTVYDAIKIINDAVDGIDVKISPIFKFLRAEDRPLKTVEKLLVNALENEGQLDVVEPQKSKNAIVQSLVIKAKQVGISLIKTPLENALNDLRVFVGYEAFKVYSKSGKPYLPSSKEVDNG